MVLLASAFDQSRYWRADDLTEPKRFRIKKVMVEVVGRGRDREEKLAVAFADEDRLLILNKTNNRTLRGAFGDDTTKWVGGVIELFRTQTEMGDGIRIRIPPPKQPSGNGEKPQALDEMRAAAGEDPPKRPIPPDDPDADFDDEIPSEGGESLSDRNGSHVAF
jgi:hypothetical protein